MTTPTKPTMRGGWVLMRPDGKCYHGGSPNQCAKAEQEDRMLDAFAALSQRKPPLAKKDAR